MIFKKTASFLDNPINTEYSNPNKLAPEELEGIIDDAAKDLITCLGLSTEPFFETPKFNDGAVCEFVRGGEVADVQWKYPQLYREMNGDNDAGGFLDQPAGSIQDIVKRANVYLEKKGLKLHKDFSYQFRHQPEGTDWILGRLDGTYFFNLDQAANYYHPSLGVNNIAWYIRPVVNGQLIEGVEQYVEIPVGLQTKRVKVYLLHQNFNAALMEASNLYIEYSKDSSDKVTYRVIPIDLNHTLHEVELRDGVRNHVGGVYLGRYSSRVAVHGDGYLGENLPCLEFTEGNYIEFNSALYKANRDDLHGYAYIPFRIYNPEFVTETTAKQVKEVDFKKINYVWVGLYHDDSDPEKPVFYLKEGDGFTFNNCNFKPKFIGAKIGKMIQIAFNYIVEEEKVDPVNQIYFSPEMLDVGRTLLKMDKVSALFPRRPVTAYEMALALLRNKFFENHPKFFDLEDNLETLCDVYKNKDLVNELKDPVKLAIYFSHILSANQLKETIGIVGEDSFKCVVGCGAPATNDYYHPYKESRTSISTHAWDLASSDYSAILKSVFRGKRLSTENPNNKSNLSMERVEFASDTYYGWNDFRFLMPIDVEGLGLVILTPIFETKEQMMNYLIEGKNTFGNGGVSFISVNGGRAIETNRHYQLIVDINGTNTLNRGSLYCIAPVVKNNLPKGQYIVKHDGYHYMVEMVYSV